MEAVGHTGSEAVKFPERVPFLNVRIGRRVRAVALGLVVTIYVVALRLVVPDLPSTVEAISFDIYQQLSPRVRGDVPVRVLDIDEPSLTAYGQWPWPRTLVAKLASRLLQLGAATVAFDVIFAEPDATSPTQIASSMAVENEADRERLKTILSTLPDHDEVLASAVTGAPVIFGFAVTGQPTERRPTLRAGIAFAGADPATVLPPFQGVASALPVLQKAAKGEGSVSLSGFDTTGIVRRAPMLVTDGKQVYPGLAIEALRVAQGASTITIRSTGASGEAAGGGKPAIVDLRVGALTVPLTGTGELWMYYDHERRERYISAARVLAGNDDAALREQIEGTIVFVGSSAAGLLDIRSTALRENVPGVSIHAQAAEQILNGTYLSRPDWAEGLEVLATVLFGGVVILCLVLLPPSIAMATVTGLMLLIIGGGWLAFTQAGLLLEPILPSLSAGIIFAVVLGLLYFSGDREKRFIRQAFTQYLEPALVRKLEENPQALKLGGETRPLTIMFMDIRGFTPISENLTADELVAFLNKLLSPLSDVILHEQGTIDKYIGDSIMAFWNAPLTVPDHALRACRAALAMQAVLKEMNEQDAFGFAAMGLPDPIVRIGIGINTGEACVGNVGSSRRFNYSVVGDEVNVAARVEASCKEVGAGVLVSQNTAVAAAPLALLEAGSVELKGKSEPMRLYLVAGDEAVAAQTDFQDLRRRHGALMATLASGEASRGRELVASCRELGGESLSSFYDRFDRQVDALRLAA